MAERWKTSDLIDEIEPTTRAGRFAKAKVALELMDENDSDDTSTRMGQDALRMLLENG